MAKILLVEDDLDFASRVVSWLEHDRHAVESVSDGDEGLDRILSCQYDLIVLDWNIPGTSGLILLEEFRNRGGKTPVLMLTGRNAVKDKTTGLDAGADDYLTKPFDLHELSARIRALLRRPSEVTGNLLQLGQIEMDTAKSEVRVAGKPVNLLPLEYSLLEFLLRHPNRVFDHSSLVEKVWKSDSVATREAVRTCVMALRKKISSPDVPSIIKTVHGIGYKVESDD